MAETVSNFFALDGRVFHTLIHLFRFPGKVPREFIEGKRTRYLNPIRIYFVASLCLITMIQIKKGDNTIVQIKPANTANTEASENNIIDIDPSQEVSFENINEEDTWEKGKLMAVYYMRHPDIPTPQALTNLEVPNTLFNRFLYTQAAKTAHFDSNAFSKFLFSKLFWVLFLFLPILALLLKLLYIRRPYYYPEHLFFTFYTQSVFFILVALALAFSGVRSLGPIAFLLFAIYLFIAMKRFYRQGYGKTILKFVLLNIMMIPAFLLFLTLSFMVAFVFF